MDDGANLKPPQVIAALLDRTRSLGFSMGSEPRTGAMLRMLVATKPGGRVLELGTGTGLATAWLLDGMDRSASLITVDIDPKPQAVARDVLGGDPRLSIVTADATEFISGAPVGAFDLIFADAMPGKFACLGATLALLRVGGIYVGDDLLPQESWPEDHAARVPLLLADLAARQGFHMVSLAWSSGLVMLARAAEPMAALRP